MNGNPPGLKNYGPIYLFSDKWLLRYTPLEKLNQNIVLLLKGVLDFDLQPQQSHEPWGLVFFM